MLSYTLIRYRNTKNIVSWSTLADYCTILSSIIKIPYHLPAQNPCRTSWNWTDDLIRVSITTYSTFKTTSSRPIPRVSAFPFGIITSTVNPSSVRMDTVSHMNWIISTNLINRVGLGGTVEVSAGYNPLWHFCRCSYHRWVFPPGLFLFRRLTSASISLSVGV